MLCHIGQTQCTDDSNYFMNVCTTVESAVCIKHEDYVWQDVWSVCAESFASASIVCFISSFAFPSMCSWFLYTQHYV